MSASDNVSNDERENIDEDEDTLTDRLHVLRLILSFTALATSHSDEPTSPSDQR